MESSFEMLIELVVVMGWLGGITILFLSILFFQDIRQKKHAILRNFPVVGRIRYFLEKQGAYFRQYFFAHDRQELPFNRATRNWVYRAAKNQGDLVGFGSTNDLREPGSIIFINSPYPILESEHCPVPPLVIGPKCERPMTVCNLVNISAMSYGALSAPAIRALSRGAAKAGVWLNTGEGGLSPYHLEGGCDLIFQIGTAKYGVRDQDGNLSSQRLREVAESVKAFEIKISQGAKPGHGGVLPGCKVSEEVARIRGIPIGQSSLSPNRHAEIHTPDDLLDMIEHIRGITGLPVGIKTVVSSRYFPEMLCEAILKRGTDSAPDFISIDGGDGGSGAAPQVLADHVGLPLTESLPILVDTLIEAGLRKRIRVNASGKLVTSAKVAWALCMGADLVATARGFMFSLGCIQAQQCHLDTCPTGVTTQNPRLQKGLDVEDKAERVANYAMWINQEVNTLAHSCGLLNAAQFQREHARIVQSAGHSLPLDAIYPYPQEHNIRR